MQKTIHTYIYFFFWAIVGWLGLVALMFYEFTPFGITGKQFYHEVLWSGLHVWIKDPMFLPVTPHQQAVWAWTKYMVASLPWYDRFYVDLVLPTLVVVAGVVWALRTERFATRPGKFVNTTKNLSTSTHRRRMLRKSVAADQGVYLGHVGRQPFYASMEDRILVFGPPGTGKTAFMVHSLLQWMQSRRAFVVIDIKNGAEQLATVLGPELERAGYTAQVLNPTHPEKGRYNPLDEAESPEAIAELTTFLIPDSGHATTVFVENSRHLVEAIVAHLKAQHQTVSLPEVYRFLAEIDEVEELLEVLAASPAVMARRNAKIMRLVAQSERLMGSIFSTLMSSLKIFQYETIAETFSTSDFLLKNLGRGTPTALFLQFEEPRLQSTGRLLAMMVGHVLQYLIEHADGRAPVFFVAEEIGNCPVITGLREKLNTIRSRHIPFMMIFQTTGQMDKYGQRAGEGAAYFMASADCKVTFRLNDNHTQAMVSELIGQFEKEYVTKTKTVVGEKKTESRSTSRRLEPIIRPADLGKLRAFQTVVWYAGDVSLARAQPYFEAYPQYRW